VLRAFTDWPGRARQVPTFRWAAPLLAAILLAGCASDRVGFGAGTAPSLPASAPRISGLESPSTREFNRLAAMFGGVYKAPRAERMLNDVMARIASANGREAAKVTILNSPVVNAFALPSGDVFVTRGLLALANDTSEIAAVMAHEQAHVLANHAVQRAELERRSEIVSRVVAEVLEDPAAGAAVQSSGKFSLASFSRAQELEADQIGVKTIAKAGFDPYGASRFLASLGRQSAMRATLLGEKSGQRNMNFLSTHPSTPERVAQALAAARQIGGPGMGENDRNTYLAAIDGIAFGDDPAEGLVRGNRFYHPSLRFTFAAPQGFIVENSSVAVVGLAPGGSQALRFDSVKLPEGQTLASYLQSGWIEGVQVGEVETTSINGFPAVLAIAKGDEWTFRLAAIQVGPATYRFILAAKTWNPEIDRLFRASIDSFRTLTAEEIANLRPSRIQVVTARPGDTVETLAARMSTDRPVERFQLLNGMERNGPLRPGQSYKTVVE
jgi:predicted Zn-dependent protease